MKKGVKADQIDTVIFRYDECFKDGASCIADVQDKATTTGIIPGPSRACSLKQQDTLDQARLRTVRQASSTIARMM